MNQTDFTGSKELVAMLDEAVASQDTNQVIEAVKEGLCRLIRDERMRLPEELTKPSDESYARRLLYKDPEAAYEVIAMIWGPGQGTPLHDHCGIWCVDGVLPGQVAVTQYDLLERDGERFLFRAQQTVHAGVGTAGSLIPPFEYHTIRNDRPDPSITIHVYGGLMDRCTVFEPESKGWYRRHEKMLAYS